MIHPTAIVDAKAEIGSNVEIGPYTVIHDYVFIGSDSVIGSHVVIEPYVTIGSECRIFQYAAIGAPPQSLKFKGEKTYLFTSQFQEFGLIQIFRFFNLDLKMKQVLRGS